MSGTITLRPGRLALREIQCIIEMKRVRLDPKTVIDRRPHELSGG